jgi:hypothetical protein
VKLYLSSERFEKTTHLVTKTRDKIIDIQADQIAKVDKLVTNYKKDSKDRKTQTYLNKKLEDLAAKSKVKFKRKKIDEMQEHI